jgi:uncharacterized protein (DUF302 family)
MSDRGLSATEDSGPAGIVTRASSGSVDDTVTRLRALLDAKGLTLFAEIDHSGEARANGLELRDTKVLIFGNPKGGTPAMRAAPLLALDLPLKLLVWDDEGQTRISYTDPAALAARYSLSDELAAPLAGIAALAQAAATGLPLSRPG